MTNTLTAVIITAEKDNGGREIARNLALKLHYIYVYEQVIRLATENKSATEVEWFIRETTRRQKLIIVSCEASRLFNDWPGVINIFIRSTLSHDYEVPACIKQPDREAPYLPLARSTNRELTHVRHFNRPARSIPQLG